MYKNEIGISKNKSIFLIVGCILFIAMSIAFIQFSHAHLYKKIFMGLIIIPFSLLGIYVFIRMLYDKSKKLVISNLGIEDYFTNPSVGLIRWEDITEITIIKIYKSKMLAIYVHNPDEYLEKISLKKRRGLKNNQRLVGTPFITPLYQLDSNSKRILASIDMAFKDWKTSIQTVSNDN